jgi:hypothetical protein
MCIHTHTHTHTCAHWPLLKSPCFIRIGYVILHGTEGNKEVTCVQFSFDCRSVRRRFWNRNRTVPDNLTDTCLVNKLALDMVSAGFFLFCHHIWVCIPHTLRSFTGNETSVLHVVAWRFCERIFVEGNYDLRTNWNFGGIDNESQFFSMNEEDTLAHDPYRKIS